MKKAGKILRCLPSAILLLALGACGNENPYSMVGTLERDRIELKVESNEPITRIQARDGNKVKQGEIILEQDNERALATLARQSALLRQSEARLAELESGPRQEAIRQSRARLESLQAQTVNAEAELQRAQEIFDQGLSNQASLDHALATAKSARAEENAAKEALTELLHGTRPEQLQQAAAEVEAGKAVMKQAEIDLQRLTLRAPMDGTIDKILFQAGERPPVGTTAAVLLDSSRVFARIYVPEHLRARVQPGEQLAVKIDGVDGDFRGTVRWVSADASFTPYFALTEHDRSRLSYLAEVDLQGAAGLPSGLPLEVSLPPQ